MGQLTIFLSSSFKLCLKCSQLKQPVQVRLLPIIILSRLIAVLLHCLMLVVLVFIDGRGGKPLIIQFLLAADTFTVTHSTENVLLLDLQL